MGILRADWVKYALDSNVPLKPTLILLLTIVIILPVSSFATLKVGTLDTVTLDLNLSDDRNDIKI